VFSKVVYIQYVQWSLPFLLLAHFIKKDRLAGLAYFIASLACIMNPERGPIVPKPVSYTLNVIMAIVYLIACTSLIAQYFDRSRLDGGIRALRKAIGQKSAESKGALLRIRRK
jgi:hypothetical protein